jgi:hypothetical protein
MSDEFRRDGGQLLWSAEAHSRDLAMGERGVGGDQP